MFKYLLCTFNKEIHQSIICCCQAGPWNLSYECITSTAALNEWFQLVREYRAKIEGDQPLQMDLVYLLKKIEKRQKGVLMMTIYLQNPQESGY